MSNLSSQIHYSVLTPSLVPPELAVHKKVNLADSFILRRIQCMLVPARAQYTFSTWEPLNGGEIEQINSTRALIVAGANPLSDDYTIVHGMTRESLQQVTVPIVPFALGITGEPGRNRGMSETTRNILLDVHRRIDASAWRCPRTLRYFVAQVPELAPKAMMTGCPVIYDEPLLKGTPFGESCGTIAVTVTERERGSLRSSCQTERKSPSTTPIPSGTSASWSTPTSS